MNDIKVFEKELENLYKLLEYYRILEWNLELNYMSCL